MAYLDRRIRIILTAVGEYDDDGIYQEGAVISDASQWARFSGAGSTDVEGAGGARIVERVNFTIRWDLAIYNTFPNQMRIIDEYGRDYNIEYIADAGVRRRYLTIAAIGTSGEEQ